jgi:Arc/MetJ-type ribon-helix-helix transcriptional regulator
MRSFPLVRKTQLSIRIPDAPIEGLDDLVAGGRAGRSDAVRLGVELLLAAERERGIAEEYVVAYGRRPPEIWVGQAGLRLGAKLVRDDDMTILEAPHDRPRP